MAASFGEKLLGEVHLEGLDELLHDLRDLSRSLEDDSSRLGVDGLDALLEVFMPPTSVVQAQYPQNPDREMHMEDPTEQNDQRGIEDGRNAPTGDRAVPAPSRGKRGEPVLEISSTSSAAGKSQLLYYLTAIAVLPVTFSGIRVGGRDSAVVFIDTDGRFDSERLRTIALGILYRKLRIHVDRVLKGAEAETNPSTPTSEDLDIMVKTSLQHVHVFRPQSSSSFLATLKSLAPYLLDPSRHVSGHKPLHAVFIDSATAFLWQDKLHDEVARTENIGRSAAEIDHERKQKRIFSLADLYAEIVQELKRLQRRFGCAVAYTCNAWGGRSISAAQSRQQAYKPSGPFDLYTPPRATVSNMPSFRCPLPAPWGVFPTLRLVVCRDAVRPFPPMMTVKDARQDAAMRRKVVLQGRFLGWVNEWGREDWSRRITEGLNQRNGGVFTFKVGRDGVEFLE